MIPIYIVELELELELVVEVRPMSRSPFVCFVKISIVECKIEHSKHVLCFIISKFVCDLLSLFNAHS